MNRNSHLIKTPRVGSFKVIFGLKNSSVHSTSWLDIASQSDSINILSKTNISHQKAEKVWKLTKTSKNSARTPHMKKEIQKKWQKSKKKWQKSTKNWQKIVKYAKKNILTAISGLVAMFLKFTGKKPSLEAKNCYEEKILHDLIKNSKSLRFEKHIWRIPFISLLFVRPLANWPLIPSGFYSNHGEWWMEDRGWILNKILNIYSF